MAWIESHTTLREHPKTKRLSRLLGINRREAIGLLHILWWWVLDFAPEGDLSALSDEDVADSIDWQGDAAQLMEALVEAGFVDPDRRVHDWDEFAEKWIERRRANAARMRLAREKRNGAAHSDGVLHVQDTSGARAPQKSKSVGLPVNTGPTNQPDQPGECQTPTVFDTPGRAPARENGAHAPGTSTKAKSSTQAPPDWSGFKGRHGVHSNREPSNAD